VDGSRPRSWTGGRRGGTGIGLALPIALAIAQAHGVDDEPDLVESVRLVDYIRVYVRRLREKLGDDPEHPRRIQTERRLGYRFIAPTDAPHP
jgi:hypothetical protein